MSSWLLVGARAYSGFLWWAVKVLILALAVSVTSWCLVVVCVFIASRRSRVVRAMGVVGVGCVVLICALSALEAMTGHQDMQWRERIPMALAYLTTVIATVAGWRMGRQARHQENGRY